MPRILLTTHIQAPVQRVFDLSRSIDLHKASAAQTNEQAIAGKTSGLISLGETVTWRARHFGIWQQMTVEITDFDPPYYFQDSMVNGPFKIMCHDHFFEEKGDSTVMKDDFYFESPLGVLGKLVNKLVLTSYLSRFLHNRNQLIKEVAEGEKCKDFI